MIQRVQTLWLIAALMVQALLWWFPFAVPKSDFPLVLSLNRLPHLFESAFGAFLSLYLCWALASLSALLAIFLFKNRKIQMRVVVYGLIATVLFCVFAWIAAYKNSHSLGFELDLVKSFALFLPVFSFFFLFKALQGIRKDEALIRSLNRIR